MGEAWEQSYEVSSFTNIQVISSQDCTPQDVCNILGNITITYC